MRIRTYSNIAVPMALLALACAASRPTAVFAGAWLAAGVMAIGYRSLDSFRHWGSGRPGDRGHCRPSCGRTIWSAGRGTWVCCLTGLTGN